METTQTTVSLDAVTATANGNTIYVGDAKKVAVLVRREDHTSGSSEFSFKGSLDSKDSSNPTLTDFNLMVDNTANSNSEQLTRVSSKTLSADGDALLWMDPIAHLNWLQINVTETTDGTHSAWIIKFS